MPTPVTWSLVVPADARPRAGGVFTVELGARIEGGWHVYAIAQPAGGPIAMTIALPEDPTFSLAGPVVEPPPIRKHDRASGLETVFHETAATFAVPVRVAGGAASRAHTLAVEVEFQACKDTECLRPVTTLLKTTITVLQASQAAVAQPAIAPRGGLNENPSADVLLDTALKQARADGRHVLVEFGASWCAPCLKLRQFLDAPAVRAVLGRHYVVMSINVGDQPRLDTPGGQGLMTELGGSATPYFVVLDAADPRPPKSQGSGLPSDAASRAAFLSAFERTATGLSAVERDALVGALPVPNSRLEMLSMRRAWASMDVGMVPVALSTDGRYLGFNDTYHWGNLVVHDVVTNADRLFVPETEPDNVTRGWALAAAFSRDQRFAAFTWWSEISQHWEMRVATLAGGGATAPRVLVSRDDVEWIQPYDWSPDGRWLAAEIWREGAAEAVLVSADDGALTLLASLGQAPDPPPHDSLVTRMAFTPDGRYVAFDVAPDAHTKRRDIRVLSVEEQREVRGVAHAADDGFVGWWPDGTRLLFTSDRTGRTELWSAEFHDGAFDEPSVVEGVPDLTGITPLGLTSNGTFAFATTPSRLTNVWSATVDFESGAFVDRPTELVPEFVGRNLGPVWSPDGRALAYLSRRDTGMVTAVKSIADGRVREFPAPDPLIEYSWTPDSRTLAIGTEADGTRTVLQLDPATGRQTVIASDATGLKRWTNVSRIYFDRPVPGGSGATRQTAVVERNLLSGEEREVLRGQSGGGSRLAVSPDGRTIYYRRPVPVGSPPHDLVARDFSTGAERVLVSGEPLGRIDVSPDGRYVLTTTTEEAGRATVLLLVPATPGESPLRLRVGSGPASGSLSWAGLAPDGRSTLAMWTAGDWVTDSPARTELWWIPFDGRPAKCLEVNPSGVWFDAATVRADGRVALTRTQHLPVTVWFMELGGRHGATR